MSTSVASWNPHSPRVAGWKLRRRRHVQWRRHAQRRRQYQRRHLAARIEGLEPRLLLAQDLLLADPITDSIRRFEAETGAPLGAFVASGAGGLVDPLDPTFGPDGNLYVINNRPDAAQILRYDGTNGDFIDVFIDTDQGGFSGASAIEFGPDQHLYVATNSSDGVLRYDGATAASLGSIAEGDVTLAAGINFGDDGLLYVLDSDGLVNTLADRILRYDISTNDLVDQFVSPGHMDDVAYFAFGPDGHLYVPDIASPDIRRFNGTTGSFNGVFSFGELPGGIGFDVAFGNDGHVYVSTPAGIERLTTTTATYIDRFVDGVTGTFTFFPPSRTVDLGVEGVTTGEHVLIGNDLTVSYRVENSADPFAADDHWFDSVYLSSDSVFDPADREIARIERSASTVGGQAYNDTLTVSVPDIVPGEYQLFVVADSQGQLNDHNRIDNFESASLPVSVIAPCAIGDTDSTLAVGRAASSISTAGLESNELVVTYSVYNVTACFVGDVSFSVELQPGIGFVSASESVAESDGVISWDIGQLGPLDVAEVELVIALPDPVTVQIDRGASVQGIVNLDDVVADTSDPLVLRTDPIDTSLLETTAGAQLDDFFVRSKAAELNQDPASVLRYVADDIGFESYAGALRGARGAMWSSAANALDQATLLVALLRASGVPAEYVAGTLSTEPAQELILSMFPEPLRVIGCLGPHLELSDPANDPALLAETQTHYWTRFDAGNGFVEFDPSFEGAESGIVRGFPQQFFTEVPDSLRHKATIRVVREITQPGLFGDATQDTQTVLSDTFEADELTGRPITIGFDVSTVSRGFVISATTHTYTPYIVAGDVSADSTSDPILFGESFTEILSNLPFGSRVVTGLFLEVDIEGPTGATETHRHTIGDRLGNAVRRNGGGGSINSSDPIVTPLDFTSLQVLGNRMDLTALDAMNAELRSLEAEAVRSSLGIDPLSDGFASEGDARLTSLFGTSFIAMARSRISQFLAMSDAFTDQMADGALVKAYFDSPRIIVLQTSATLQPDGATSVHFSMNLLRDVIRGIAYPGQVSSAELGFQFNRGVSETIVESFALGVPPNNTTQPVVSAQRIFTAAIDTNTSFVVLDNGNRGLLDGLNFSADAKALISEAIDLGKVIMVPSRSIEIDGEPRIAWYESDPATGVTIDVLDTGGHQATLESAFVRSMSFVITNVIQYSLGVFAGVGVGTAFDLFRFLFFAGVTAASDGLPQNVQDVLMWKNKIGAFFNFAIQWAKGFPNVAFFAGFVVGLKFSYDVSNDPPIEDVLISPPPYEPLQNIDTGSGTFGVKVVPDPLFFLPINNSQVRTLFRAGIRNDSTEAKRFRLEVSDTPVGFDAQTSVTEIGIPAGETAEIGVCLVPTGGFALPGTDASFSFLVTNVADENIQLETDVPFQVPELHGVETVLEPIELSTSPGVAIPLKITSKATGNVREDIEFEIELSEGLTLEGLENVSIPVGGTEEQILTLIPDPDVAINSELAATITVDFGTDFPEQFVIPVRIVAPGVESIASAAVAVLDQLDNVPLHNRLNDLSVALSNLTQSPSSSVFRDQAIASLDSIVTLLAVDEFLADFVGPISTQRAQLARAETPDEVRAAVVELGAVLDGFALAVTEFAAHQFRLFVTPNSLVAQADVPSSFEITIQNDGTKTTLYHLELVGVPASVQSSLEDEQVTLAPGEIKRINGSFTQPSSAGLVDFDFRVDVGVSDITTTIERSAPGTLRARSEIIAVTSVDVAPSFGDPGSSVAISARILNAVNRAQNAEVTYRVTDPSGSEVFSLPEPVPVALSVQSSISDVDLGALDTAGFTLGEYIVDVTVIDPSGEPIPGGSGLATFLIGSPLNVDLSVAPEALLPGDQAVRNTLTLSGEVPLGVGTLQLVAALPAAQFGGDTIAGVNVLGDTVYVHGSGTGDHLHIVDVSDPTSPIHVRQESGQFSSFGIVDGDRLFTIWAGSSEIGRNTLRRFDLNGAGEGTRRDPLMRGSVSSAYVFASDVAVKDDFAFVSAGQVLRTNTNEVIEQNGTVLVYDVSDPDSPELVDTLFNSNGTTDDGSVNMGGDFFIGGIGLTGSTLLVASSTSTGSDTSVGTGELLVVDVTDPIRVNSDEPANQNAVVNRLSVPGSRLLLDIVIDDQMAYVLGSTGGFADGAADADANDLGPTGQLTLTSVSLADPHSPAVIHTETFDRRPQGTSQLTVLSPGWLALTSNGELDDPAQVTTFDVRDPDHFVVEQAIQDTGTTRGLASDGRHVYVTADDGLFVYELIPESPVTPIGQLPIAGSRGVAARDDVSYVCGANGINVVDYADPTQPTTVTKVGVGGHIGCKLEGNLLLAIRNPSGAPFVLDVYSVHNDPLNPQLLGTSPEINYVNLPSGLEANETHAFVTQFTYCQFLGSGDIYVHQGELLSIAFNLDDPENPTSASPQLENVLFDDFGDASPNSVVPDVSGCPQNGGDHNVFGVALPTPNTAYLAASSVVGTNTQAGVGLVQIVDVTDPTTATVIRDVEIPGTVQAVGIGVDGDTGLVIGSTTGWNDPANGLRDGNLTVTTFDLADPLDPQLISHRVLDRRARAFWTNTGTLGDGLFAFASIDFEDGNDNPELLLIDASNPRNPFVISTGFALDTIPPNSISSDGEWMFTSDASGLSILEIGESPAIPATANILVPNRPDVVVNIESFSTPPDQIIEGSDFDTLIWNVTLTPGDEERVITWDTDVLDLNPGSSRLVNLESFIDFGYRRSFGQQLIAPNRVFAEQILSLTPATQVVRPGDATSFTLTLNNPTDTAIAFDLDVRGIPESWVEWATDVVVQAGATTNVPFTITPDAFATLDRYGFVIDATARDATAGDATAGDATTGDATSSVEGSITLAGDPELPPVEREARSVLVQLPVNQRVTGQGNTARFEANVVNTGSQMDEFQLSITGLPASFAATASDDSLTIAPGASNGRQVLLHVSPPVGTPAEAYPFLLIATSVTDASVTHQAEGVLVVDRLGVHVELTPAAQDPARSFEFIVTNTGDSVETFDLTLGGPAALVASLETDEVTLEPGRSQTIATTAEPIEFSVPGAASLFAIATSRTNDNVRDTASVDVAIDIQRGLRVSTDNDLAQLPLPDETAFSLLVENTGNATDQYTATIIETDGPISASLVGLDGIRVSSIPVFVLPGLASGAIAVDTVLTDFGTGTVTIEVRSQLDGTLFGTQTFTASTVDDFDYGDAPDGITIDGVLRQYATSRGNDPARHVITEGPILGNRIDGEVVGQSSPGADGDGIDEDGVIQIASLVASTTNDNTASFWVTASGQARLDSWIDLNGDGTFDHVSEHMQQGVSQELSAGPQIVSAQIPAAALPGTSYGRFRLSTAGSLAPDGAAVDGEVEDYRLAILDGDAGADAVFNLIVGAMAVRTEDGNAVARHEGIKLFSAPADALASARFDGTDEDDSLSLGQLRGTLPFSYFGGAGIDRLQLLESNQSIDVVESSEVNLSEIEILDVVGTGSNTLGLDRSGVIASTDSNDTLVVIHDEDDAVNYRGADWSVLPPIFVDQQQRHVLINDGARVETINTRSWTNPLHRTDVNRSGDTTVLDALQIINLLFRNESSSIDLPAPASREQIANAYYDVNGSQTATALDALNVLNFILRENGENALAGASAEATEFEAVVDSNVRVPSVEHDDRPTKSWESAEPLIQQKQRSNAMFPTAITQSFDFDRLDATVNEWRDEPSTLESIEAVDRSLEEMFL